VLRASRRSALGLPAKKDFQPTLQPFHTQAATVR
jgi:hypothetical protein